MIQQIMFFSPAKNIWSSWFRIVHSFAMQNNSMLVEFTSHHLNTAFLDISHSSSLNYGYILSQRLDRNAQKWAPVGSPFYLEPDLFEYAITQ